MITSPKSRNNSISSNGNSVSWIDDVESISGFDKFGLKGRNDELIELFESFQRVRQNQSFEVVAVEGVGRTTFIKSLLGQEQEEQPLRFGYGKYCCDNQQSQQPYQAITSALNQMCSNDNEQLDLQHLSQKQINLLSHWIPNLSQFIAQDPSSFDTVADQSRRLRPEDVYQFPTAVCKLLRAVSSLKVLILDDIQWADPDSKLVIQTIANDEQLSNLLFVVSTSSSEVTNIYSTVDIELLPLKPDQLRDLLGHTLNTTTRKSSTTDDHAVQGNSNTATISTELVQFIYDQTKGDPLHTQQLIQYLQQHQLLNPNSDGQWQYKNEDKDDSSFTLEYLVQHKINQYPHLQPMLQLAAFIGYSFTQQNLGESSSELLDEACEAGILKDENTHGYSFVHDIYHSKYRKLVDDVPATHLSISQNQSLDNFKRVRSMYLATRGSKQDVVKELYGASQEAMKAGAYYCSADFLQKARTFTGTGNWWRSNYGLTLKVMNASAQIEYIVGNIRESYRLAEDVVRYASCPRDKLAANTLRLELETSAVSSYDSKEVIDLGTSMLADFDVTFPPCSKSTYVMMQLYKTKRILKGLSDKKILGLEPMEDDGVVQLLGMTSHLALLAEEERFPIVGFNRLLQMSLSGGSSGSNRFLAYAFAVYSVIQQTMGNTKEAHRFAKLAVQLAKRLGEEYASRAIRIAYEYVLYAQIEIGECASPFHQALESSLAAGNVVESYSMAAIYGKTCYYAGVSLQTISADMKEIHRRLDKFKLHDRSDAKPVWQMALNLMGESPDPVKLTGLAMNEEDVISEAERTKNHQLTQHVRLTKMQVAVMFRAWEVARIQMREIEKHASKYFFQTYDYIMFLFLSSIINFEIARQSEKRKYLLRARKLLKCFQKYGKSHTQNVKPLIAFLKAENLAIRHSTEVRKHFEPVIALLNGTSPHMEAFCNERAARYICPSDSFHAKKLHLNRAADLYKQWGNRAKADDLKKRFPSFFTEPAGDTNTAEKSVISDRTFVTSNVSTKKKTTSDANSLPKSLPTGFSIGSLVTRNNSN